MHLSSRSTGGFDAGISISSLSEKLFSPRPRGSRSGRRLRWSGACGELRADCAAANSHYKKVEDQKVSQVTDKIYNSYLQTVGVESGRQSYGEVVDLLTAWYFSQEVTQ